MYYHLTRTTRSFIYTCNHWGWCRGRGAEWVWCGTSPLLFLTKTKGRGGPNVLPSAPCILGSRLFLLSPVNPFFFETQWFCYLYIPHPASLIHKHPLPWDSLHSWRYCVLGEGDLAVEPLYHSSESWRRSHEKYASSPLLFFGSRLRRQNFTHTIHNTASCAGYPWDAKNDRSIWRFFGGIFMSRDFCGRCLL